MGTLIPTGLDAPMKLADALGRGTHVGMLVDQYYGRGVDVTFFGRRTKANPLLARLARHFDCPIHGTRIVRLPNHRFRAELTEEIKPVRDAEGKIDVAKTTQVVMSIIEEWIREHPEQWLWLHRRWRPEDYLPVNDRS
jgi:KDO2-lipid IV(A) lauroyltransferase